VRTGRTYGRAMYADTPPSDRRTPTARDRLDTSVRDIMCPGVLVLAEDASVRQAEHALLGHDAHAVLVLKHDTGRPLGWVTSRGLLQWCERDTELSWLGNAVTEAAVTITPSATARQALELLDVTGATRLLVARRPDGLPIGVVADVDLLRLHAR